MWLALVSSLLVSLAITWSALRPDSRLVHTDIPNHRSLHTQATRSGGGVGIVLGCVAGGAVLTGIGAPSYTVGFLVAAALALAVAGYIDDRQALAAPTRLIIHIAVAVAVILAGPKLNSFALGDFNFDFPWWLAGIFTGLFVCWMINLYNFMDGMDGLAATMAVVGFGTLGWLGFTHGDEVFAGVAWIISASSLGFLMFNFPPARIFMGDTGSTALGYAAAVMLLWADQAAIAPFWIGILIFSPFIVDSTTTLVWRGLAGERLWEAHKTHYYQRLIGLGWSHRYTLLAETALMLACAVTAVTVLNQSPPIQWLTVALWLAIYPILMYSVHRMEASSPRKS
ncbi:MAG TPA: glycosyltransferase family 4 protein [Alphaproteobacteria bacterium]|nr:glycosyltransferase family 4 protein [Myxococcales bacterium]HIN93533.1 glycosyltransferase family 4 protein [Alphaproteobacteria bacterium]